MKAIGFESLRLQYEMSTPVSKILTYYLIQLYLLKR